MRADPRTAVRVWWIGIPLGVAFLDRSLRDGAVDALVVVGRSLGVTLVVMILAMPIFVLATRSDPLTTRDGAWIVGSFFAWYVATWLAGWLPALAYNWDGLITATAVVSILIAARSDLPLAEMGISLPSHPGWFWPTVAMAGAAVAYALVLDPGGTTLTGEGWASNLTLPGLSEELLFRGLLLGILDNRLGRPWRLWGTRVGWGLIITTALFGLAHAVQPFQGVRSKRGSSSSSRLVLRSDGYGSEVEASSPRSSRTIWSTPLGSLSRPVREDSDRSWSSSRSSRRTLDARGARYPSRRCRRSG